jgi:septal ring factor EnvC (AmiA/AmiB activator)
MKIENCKLKSNDPGFFRLFQFAIFILQLSICNSPAFAAKKDYDREIARQRKELDDLKATLEKEQRALESLNARKASSLERLEKLSGNIQLTEQYLRKLEATEGSLNGSVANVRKEMGGIEARIRDRNAIMARRVRVLFMSGGPGRLLLQAWEPGQGDLLRKVFFMKRILRYDRSLVEDGRQDAELKRKTLAKLDAKIEELAGFRTRKSQEMASFSRAKKNQEKVFQELQSSVETKREALRELEENAKLINEIIAALEKKRRDELARNKKASVLETGSRYCLPVEGEVVSKYGLQYHSTLKTTTKNLGIEIQGKPGGSVRAAVSGEVALITRIPGYGLGVILDNGSNYFTIYANLAFVRVRQGDKVKTCEDLASVSSGTGRVYFEVRSGTRTLDPAQWLKGSGR